MGGAILYKNTQSPDMSGRFNHISLAKIFNLELIIHLVRLIRKHSPGGVRLRSVALQPFSMLDVTTAQSSEMIVLISFTLLWEFYLFSNAMSRDPSSVGVGHRMYIVSLWCHVSTLFSL